VTLCNFDSFLSTEQHTFTSAILLLLIVVNMKKLWRRDTILWHRVHSKLRDKESDDSRFKRGTHRQYSNLRIIFYTFYLKNVMKKIRKEFLLFSGIFKQWPDI